MLIELELYAKWLDPDFRMHALRLQSDPEYRTEFQSRLRALPNAKDAWINSPLWKETSKLKRRMQPYCADCGRTSSLEAHHNTYIHWGIEVLHLQDLDVLCRNCHAIRHGIDLAYSDRPRILSQDSITLHQLRFTFEPGSMTVERVKSAARSAPIEIT